VVSAFGGSKYFNNQQSAFINRVILRSDHTEPPQKPQIAEL
jgi:hypothetical protein